MPFYGKLGDLVGRKWLFVVALALFLLGSVVGGLAGSMPVLIAARAVQGLGAGGLMVLAQAIIADVVPPRERGRYMAVVGSVFIFSSVAGPLLGGWFTATIGWRWAFWMNVPIAVLAIVAAITHLSPATTRPRVGEIGLALIPLRLLADREFVLATAGGLCGALAMFGAAGYLPTYLQMVDGLRPAVAGLFMVPMVAGIGTTSFISGHVMSRTGRYTWMPVAGAAVVAAALVLLSLLRVSTSPWVVGAGAYLFGAGMGFGMQTLAIVAQNA